MGFGVGWQIVCAPPTNKPEYIFVPFSKRKIMWPVLWLLPSILWAFEYRRLRRVG